MKSIVRKIILCFLSFTTLFSLTLPLNAGALAVSTNTSSGGISWVDAVKQAQALFKDGGGYYTGRATSPNTWEGMDAAYQLGTGDTEPTIDISKARPSFCSSATYMLFVKSLQIWNESRNILTKDAWINLKPYTMAGTTVNGKTIPIQSDGYGLWGRCNANGPGPAVMAQELKVGKNYYVGNKNEYTSQEDYYKAWNQAKPYDFMKIFWNSGIGCEDSDPSGDEAGHMVLFLKKEKAYDNDGTRDDLIYWWSSNGYHKDLTDASGYGIESCHESKIYRAVLTEITNPENFKNAANIAPDNMNIWLDSLNGKHHGTVAEMDNQCDFQKLVTSFDQLKLGTEKQEVETGTPLSSLDLPDSLNATVNEKPEKLSGITWDSDRTYNAETVGTYAFTPVLPDGYTVGSGTVLPTITVTVRQTYTPPTASNSVQAGIPSSVVSPSTNISVILSGAVFPSDITSVTLNAELEQAASKPVKDFTDALSRSNTVHSVGAIALYNIELLSQNNSAISDIRGDITVSLPLPNQKGDWRVFWFDDKTGTLTDMKATVANGFATFKTTHMSYYALVSLGDGAALDTSSYQMYLGGHYSFLVKNHVAGVTYTASAVDENIIKTFLTNKKYKGDWLFTIYGQKTGNTNVIVKGSDGSFASFPVIVRNRSLTLDTRLYEMTPGGRYQIGSIVKGANVRNLKITSTNPGTVSIISISNGNCKIAGHRFGNAYIMYDWCQDSKKVAHASVRVTVRQGIKAAGDSTRQTAWF